MHGKLATFAESAGIKETNTRQRGPVTKELYTRGDHGGMLSLSKDQVQDYLGIDGATTVARATAPRVTA